MKDKIIFELKESARIKNQTADLLADNIVLAVNAIVECYKNGGKLLVMGNGGSAADSQHIAAEFISSFQMNRKALPAIALTTDTSILTAIGNDKGYENIFLRQIEALANHSADIIMAISTSGNSLNIVRAVEFAKKNNLKTIGLSGQGGKLKDLVDFPIAVPSSNTQRIQETHITISHAMCGLIEQTLFNN